MAAAPVPPRVILVMPDQWPRALLRAALREIGYDASGTRALTGAVYQTVPEPGRGPVRLVVLDQSALTPAGERHLEALRQSTGAPIVLLARGTSRVREGPWARVVRRPTSIGSLVQAIETLIPLSAEARQPVD